MGGAVRLRFGAGVSPGPFAQKDDDGVFRYQSTDEPVAEVDESDIEDWFTLARDPEVAAAVAEAEAVARTLSTMDRPSAGYQHEIGVRPSTSRRVDPSNNCHRRSMTSRPAMGRRTRPCCTRSRRPYNAPRHSRGTCSPGFPAAGTPAPGAG